ncbi:hypothetical protein AX15_006591 [Amanita polypyramis BW_CC]|nr:hypothetical protein AX15_006591 [Amanita polypyramis BW_CC]
MEVLNFSLAMEHLLSEIYKEGLAKYNAQDFENAGHPPFVYGRLKEIAQQENKHVNFLTAAISAAGTQPIRKCEYRLPFDSPNSFVHTVSALESGLTSSYCGSQAFLRQKEHSTLAATILATEARHSAWLDSAVSKFNPWSTALETPLTRRHAYSLVFQYISNCPDSNTIPETFPTLEFISTPIPGQRVRVKVENLHIEGISGQGQPLGNHMWVAFLTGEGIRYAETHALNGDDSNSLELTVPTDLFGSVYAIVTNSNKRLSDETTIAGPTLLTFPYNSEGKSV